MTHGTCRHKENIGFQAGYLDLQQIFSSKGKMEFGFFWNRFAWVPVTPENKNTEVCLCGCCSDISCETWNHCVGSLVQGCFRDLSASKNQSSESLYGHRECPFEFDMIVPHMSECYNCTCLFVFGSLSYCNVFCSSVLFLLRSSYGALPNKGPYFTSGKTVCVWMCFELCDDQFQSQIIGETN